MGKALWGRRCGGGLRASMFNGGCENRGQTDCKLIKQPRSKAEITGATFCVFVAPVAVTLRSAGLVGFQATFHF